VRVEPEESDPPARLCERGRHAGDRPRAQRVVTAKHQRSAALAHGEGASVRKIAAHIGDRGKKAEGALDGREGGAVGHPQVADVLDLVPQPAQAVGELGDAEC